MTDLPTAQIEADVVERALQGDALAFEVIMRRCNRLLWRSARGVLDDDAEAQDVVQETYLRAFERLGEFRHQASLGTWLARIAINLAIDRRRQRHRWQPLAEDDDGQFTDLPLPTHDGPEAQAERGQMRALLQHAIGRLPGIYRSVFMLRAVQELSVDETAFCLQVSDAVVRTRYLRARALLRDALCAQVEAHAQDVFSFAGERCDLSVAQVLAELERRRQLPPGGVG